MEETFLTSLTKLGYGKFISLLKISLAVQIHALNMKLSLQKKIDSHNL